MDSKIAAILQEGCAGYMDFIVHRTDGSPLRIHQLYRSYDFLHYVLLFPRGKDVFQGGLKRGDNPNFLSLTSICYHFQVRKGDFRAMMKSRHLMQQFPLDSQDKIENCRLNWAENNQYIIRAEKYQILYDAVSKNDVINVGRRVVLPSTIYGLFLLLQ